MDIPMDIPMDISMDISMDIAIDMPWIYPFPGLGFLSIYGMIQVFVMFFGSRRQYHGSRSTG